MSYKLLLAFVAILPFVIADYTMLNADNTVVSEGFVKHLNSQPKITWQASTDQGDIARLTVREAKRLMGAKKGGKPLPRITYKNKKIDVPDSFDSRQNWPECATMRQIRDQSACGSCWAFGSVEAISDRYCIFNKINISLSALDMLACCDSCGDGCGGGYPSSAWAYWCSTGLVPEKCAPYPFPSCDHHIPNSPNPCPSDEYPTPDCPSNCTDGEVWDNSLHLGQTSYSVSGEDDIKTEIYQNGPVEVAFDVYADFLTYKSGVYQHTSGDYLGGHAVKMLGWGVADDGTPYWIVANSWNPHWGNQGYFWILRGQDECGIEDEADAGVPQPSRKPVIVN
jgi:C1A family cysteine protease